MMIAALALLAAARPAGPFPACPRSAGAVVPGASVVVRTESGTEHRATTGPDGRFTIDCARNRSADGDRQSGRIRGENRAGAGRAHRRPGSGACAGDAARNRHRHADAHRTAARRYSGQRQRRDQQGDRGIARRSSPTMCCGRFRRSASSAAPAASSRSRRRRACRCAGSDRAAQSRTLVLLDGVPFNDPFGGWVYWTRVPLDSVDRIEIIDGPTSSLYGNYAMGGVINIITTRPTRRRSSSSRSTATAAARSSISSPATGGTRSGALVEGSFFKTDGFPIVAPIERGPIDNNANVDYRNVSGQARIHAVGPRQRVLPRRLLQRGSEQRQGRRAQRHPVDDRQRRRPAPAAGRQRPPGPRVRRRVSESHFNFLAVTNPATTRNLVRLATDQHVPTNGVGTMVQWTKALSGSNVFSAGTDWRWIDGDSQEDAYVAAVPTVIIPPVTHRVGPVGPARLRRHPADLGRVRPGHLHADARSW